MIVFVIRRLNDIDHATPIIYRLAKEGRRRLLVLCMNPFYDISNDFRLRFLKNGLNISIDYLYTYFCPSVFHKIAGVLICNPYLRMTKDQMRKKLSDAFRDC